jgi:gas vesicle structural protein
MTSAVPAGGGAATDRPSPTGLADVIDTILDKGLVIDAYVRVSLVGIELLTVDARIVVASVDTYLRYAQAVNRLDLSQTEEKGLPELLEDVNKGGAKNKTRGALEAAGETLRDALGGGDDTEREASRSGRSGRTRRED